MLRINKFTKDRLCYLFIDSGMHVLCCGVAGQRFKVSVS